MEKKGSNARVIGPMSLAVSAELRAAIARQGYNVQQFARKANLPVSTLHKTLKGQRVVDVEDVYAICDTLGISPGPLVDAAAAVALTELDDGLLPGEREGMPADYPANKVSDEQVQNSWDAARAEPNVTRLEDHRNIPIDLDAVASTRSDDRGEGDYDA